MESVIKNLPLKKTTSLDGHLYQIFKEETISILYKTLQKIENEGTFSQLFYEGGKIMVLRPVKDIPRK